jgi:hypothetical protein
MIIYCTTNKINGKKYIGKDEKNNPNYLGSGKAFLNAVKKYGKNNFKKEIIAYTDDKNFLKDLEIYYIDYYNAQTSSLFYNITKGGIGGKTHNQNYRKVKIYQFDLNKNLIKEWDCANSAAIALNLNRSKIVSECIEGGSYGKYLWSKTPFYTENNIKHKFKKIYQIDIKGNLIKIWDSLQEIQNTLGFNKANVSKAYKGKYKTAYNFKWMVEEDGLSAILRKTII